MQLKTVVLPAPFGPMTAVMACDRAENDTSSIATSQAIEDVDQQPRFVIEYLGTATPSVDCSLPQTHYRYRITALAVGASSGSRKQADTRVLLQSEYRLCLESS